MLPPIRLFTECYVPTKQGHVMADVFYGLLLMPEGAMCVSSCIHLSYGDSLR